MKVFPSFIFVCLFSTCFFPLEEEVQLATSTTGQVISHTYYSLSYDESCEQAEWVAYELTKAQANGRHSRSNNFRVDDFIFTGSAEVEDYKGSGYDRGHLVPAGDMKFDRIAMDETFYMSNISPQQRAFNSGIWNQLEIQVREWVTKFEHLYIVTGPVLSNPVKRIGKNKVVVPSHFFKVLLDNTEPEVKAIAFLLPNKRGENKLSDYVISIDELESITGIDFFPHFPDSLMNVLENSVDIKPWFENTYQRDPSIPEILANQASNYVNQICKVCGQIVDTYSSPSITHLNFGQAYPDQVFSGVIFDDYYANFSYKPAEELKGKRVCMTGKIQMHKGKPQILIRAEDQIEME